jgi:hypothetical protein
MKPGDLVPLATIGTPDRAAQATRRVVQRDALLGARTWSRARRAGACYLHIACDFDLTRPAGRRSSRVRT